MSEKNNDEKLRVLQERLAQIKEKENTANSKNKEKKTSLEEPATNKENEKKIVANKNNLTISFNWLKYLLIIGIIAYSIFYIYKNQDILDRTNNRSEIEETNNIDKKIESDDKLYKLKLDLKHETILGKDTLSPSIIIYLDEFSDEKSAKAKLIDLKANNFNKASYFYLPDHSKDPRKLYSVYLGPYETAEEALQISSFYTKKYPTKSNNIKVVSVKK